MFETATTKARQATVVSLLDKSDEEREKEAQAEKEKQVRELAYTFPSPDIGVIPAHNFCFCVVYMYVYIFHFFVEKERAVAVYRHQPEAWFVSCSPRIGRLGWGHQSHEAPPTPTSHVVTPSHKIHMLTRSSINRAPIQEVSL